MFTLGSKTFLGAAGIAAIAAAVGAASTSNQAGVLLLVGTVAAASVIALSILVAAGASDRYSYPGGEDPAPGRDPGATIVPFVVALGAGGVVLGMALGAAGFVVGGAAVVAALVAWFSQAWRDHPAYVPALSKRVSNGIGLPFGMPVILLVIIGAIGLAVSRTLLAVTATQAWIVAIVVAALFFFGALVLATRPKLSKRTMSLVIVLAVLVIAALGIYGLVRGQRHVHHEEALAALGSL